MRVVVGIRIVIVIVIVIMVMEIILFFSQAGYWRWLMVREGRA